MSINQNTTNYMKTNNKVTTNRFQISLTILAILTGTTFARAGEQAKPGAEAVKGLYGSAALTDTVKGIFTNYFKIEETLTEDSLTNVAANARAIAKAVTGDAQKLLPAEIAKQAEELAKATELPAAREALKPLTESLTRFLADHEVKTKVYQEMFCPMANAYWLQKADDETKNPYLGKSMPQCGQINRTF
jgi:threonyl-tRNA synthetase